MVVVTGVVNVRVRGNSHRGVGNIVDNTVQPVLHCWHRYVNNTKQMTIYKLITTKTTSEIKYRRIERRRRSDKRTGALRGDCTARGQSRDIGVPAAGARCSIVCYLLLSSLVFTVLLLLL